MGKLVKGSRITVTAGGLERSAVYFKPTKPGKGEAPLVIVLHGHSGNGRKFAADTDLPALWPEAAMIYPDGLPAPGGQDPEGEEAGWQKNVGELGDRDLLLFDELLKFAADRKAPRPRKVYVAGFSNGGRLTYVLWKARARSISAVAVCAGNSVSNDLDKSLRPKPAVLIHGKTDNRLEYPHAIKSIKAILAVNKARLSFTDWLPRTSRKDYQPTEGGAETLVFTHPGGHSWPLWSSPDVVKFFRAHGR
jgi:polyhydroxybutyrate depolymerase